MSTRIPPLLESYLSLPPETSLIVLTSVLGASTNWLVLRYLHALLNRRPPPPPPAPSPASLPADGSGGTGAGDGGRGGGGGGGEEKGVSVLLVSFLRDYPFWRDAASRAGIDLEAAGRRGRFGFVDGLGMFLPREAVAGGGEPVPWRTRLGSARLEDVSRMLASAVDGLLARGNAGRVVLVVDQLDLLLATAGAEENGFGEGVRGMMLDLREKTHATILTLSADEPLVAAQTTALEKEHAALVLSALHEAQLVLSLRLLDTGTAKDVSGVVRITRGGGGEGPTVEEREYLYHVLGDGGVRVFERGQ